MGICLAHGRGEETEFQSLSPFVNPSQPSPSLAQAFALTQTRRGVLAGEKPASSTARVTELPSKKLR